MSVFGHVTNLSAACLIIIRHLSIQLLWATAQLLIPCVSPVYLADEFISLLQVLLKDMRMVSESNILSFLSISGFD